MADKTTLDEAHKIFQTKKDGARKNPQHFTGELNNKLGDSLEEGECATLKDGNNYYYLQKRDGKLLRVLMLEVA